MSDLLEHDNRASFALELDATLAAASPEDRRLTAVMCDVVRAAGDLFPVPWARSESASFLISAEKRRSILEASGFTITSWADETAIAIAWFANAASAPPRPGALSLARLIGPEFASMSANFRGNLAESRAAIVAVVGERL